MTNHHIEAFQVVGISARISNDRGSAGEEVEAIWRRFWSEDIRNKVPHIVNNDIYAVYTDYESDHTGAYTLIIGLSVTHLDDIPSGLVGVTVRADTYEKFVSRGQMPGAVLKTWMDIWQDEDLDRGYRTDFTIHGKKYFDGDQAEVETFISVD